MIKLSIRILVISILINANIVAKNNEYYYLDNRECSIAIPLDFHILGGFTKKRIVFYQEKKLETNNITILKGNQKKYIKVLNKRAIKEHDSLVEEKNIGHLVYQKYKINITKNTVKYMHHIFGNNFFWGSEGITQKDINYMIKHCLETYKNEEN